ncbi:MAG: PD40 domain-containing protein [Sedimentisphaerales bacterium]|nr:PD40 domain-containing protein [Sedimentisphaerales bacterium]
MIKRPIFIGIVAVVIILSGLWILFSPSKFVGEGIPIAYEPNISPDYSGLFIPHNIAPLNFRILEKGQAYSVRIYSESGPTITIASKTGRIRIPLKKWRRLLDVNKGRELFVDVFVRDAEGQWLQFKPIVNTIADEEIDGTLVYRFMKPIYNMWNNMGIFQRDLTDFDVSSIMQGRSFGKGCLNCHSFAGNTSGTMTICLRSMAYGSNTLLARNGDVHKIGAKWGYTAWHPSGRLAVYSINKVRQFFHAGGMEVRDVVDLDSALLCYHLDSQKVTNPEGLADKDRLETYPAWSPDGRALYFCSAPILWQDRDTVPPENYDKVKYDLRRITYDVETNRWGNAETVLSADETGLSIMLPRVSPDGRFLLFCMCRYGCFPIYQPSSDLYLMDLSTGDYRKLDINSSYSESWHSWSGNSRWIAFSSKRQGGSLTRTYLSYVDTAGKVHKPFVLPQKDPDYYDSLIETFSVPELTEDRIKVSTALLAQMARCDPSISVDIPITGATRLVKPSDPWMERE